MDAIAQQLLAAQRSAEALFAEIVDRRMIVAGKLESDLTAEIYYHDGDSDQCIGGDDVVYLDFGPVFDEWEADFGRTYVVGEDPAKHRLVGNLGDAFARGKRYFQESPNLTAGQLYAYVAALALRHGWEFGARTAGHLIGRFPHERLPADPEHFSIRHGNPCSLREPDEAGRPRHWILEIHFIDRARKFGGFYEELLTVDAAGS